MEQQLNPEFIKKLQTGVEPNTEGCGTPLDAIVKNDKDRFEKLSQIRQQNQVVRPAQETIIVGDYRVPKDFFTCLTLCLIELNHPKINKILNTFGFVMKDLDNKIVFPKNENENKHRNYKRNRRTRKTRRL